MTSDFALRSEVCPRCNGAGCWRVLDPVTKETWSLTLEERGRPQSCLLCRGKGLVRPDVREEWFEQRRQENRERRLMIAHSVIKMAMRTIRDYGSGC